MDDRHRDPPRPPTGRNRRGSGDVARETSDPPGPPEDRKGRPLPVIAPPHAGRQSMPSGPGEARREVSETTRPAASPGEARRDTSPPGMDRRTAIKVLAAASAIPAALSEGCGPEEPPGGNPLARGTPSDPDLVSPSVPWPTVLTPSELRTVAALCDVILPADDRSPSASAVGVPAFIDEWVSAPYPDHVSDRIRIRGGLVWLDREARERFGSAFVDLATEQHHAICDDICHVPDARPEHRSAALFFDRFRDLAATGFWTTEAGMADVGYVGNVPLASFDGPPIEVLDRLDLAP